MDNEGANSQQIPNPSYDHLEQGARRLRRDPERVVAPLEPDLAEHGPGRVRFGVERWWWWWWCGVVIGVRLVVAVVVAVVVGRAVAVKRRVRVEEHEPHGDEDAVRQPQHDQEHAGAGVRALPGGRPAGRVQRRGDALEEHHRHVGRGHGHGHR